MTTTLLFLLLLLLGFFELFLEGVYNVDVIDR